MEIRWKLYCEVVATHVLTQAFQQVEKWQKTQNRKNCYSGVNGRLQNFHISKKLEIANFSS